jgi:CubicO group peptidase (beta-lactamase class C family)
MPVPSTLFAVAGFTPAKPAEVGLDQAAVDGIARDMQKLVRDGRRAGIVSAVACRGRLVHAQACGWRDMEADLPMQADTLFRLYSMTRAITAAGLLTLLDEGKLALDDPVAKFLPEFTDTPVIANRDAGTTEPQQTPLTIRHLLTYTAGFGYPDSYPAPWKLTMADVLPIGGTLAAGIARLAAAPLLAQPGAQWRYGFSGDVTARVAEVVSGQSYDEFLRTRVFTPLGMRDTGFIVPAKRADDLAEIYATGPDDTLINATARAPALNSYQPDETLFSGGGGLVGTVGDYLTFGQMLLNKGKFDATRILAPATVQTMCSNQLRPDQGPLMVGVPGRGTANDMWADHNGYGWGLGISVRLDGDDQRIPGGRGECRWDGLANTTFFIDPEHEIVAVAMAQLLALDGRELEMVLRHQLYIGDSETR